MDDDLYGSLLFREGVTTNGGAASVDDLLFPPQTLYPSWVQAVNTTITAVVRHRLTYTDGLATWQIAINAGSWVTIMDEQPGTFRIYAYSIGTSQDGGTNTAKTVRIKSRPSDFTYSVPSGALPIGLSPEAP
jgi:hypothetical protein